MLCSLFSYSAQIVSVADVYDALVSDRVYKSAYSKAEAFEMICEGMIMLNILSAKKKGGLKCYALFFLIDSDKDRGFKNGV